MDRSLERKGKKVGMVVFLRSSAPWVVTGYFWLAGKKSLASFGCFGMLRGKHTPNTKDK